MDQPERWTTWDSLPALMCSKRLLSRCSNHFAWGRLVSKWWESSSIQEHLAHGASEFVPCLGLKTWLLIATRSQTEPQHHVRIPRVQYFWPVFSCQPTTVSEFSSTLTPHILGLIRTLTGALYGRSWMPWWLPFASATSIHSSLNLGKGG